MPHKREHFEKKDVVEPVLTRAELFEFVRNRELDLLPLLFEHNISDALDYCEEYRVDPGNVLACVTSLYNRTMVGKHYNFEKRLAGVIERAKPSLTERQRKMLETYNFTFNNFGLPKTEAEVGHSDNFLYRAQDPSHDPLTQYYAQQLSLREFKAPHELDENPVVQSAEMVVRSYQHMYAREVHRNQVVQLLLKWLGKWAMPGVKIDENNLPNHLDTVTRSLLEKEFISPDDIGKILTYLENYYQLPHQCHDVFMKEFYENTARPLNVVVDSAQVVARVGGRREKGIPEQIQASLARRNISESHAKIVRDELTKQYELKILDSKTEAEDRGEIGGYEFLGGGSNFQSIQKEAIDGIKVTAYGGVCKLRGPADSEELTFVFNNKKENLAFKEGWGKKDSHFLSLPFDGSIDVLAYSRSVPAAVIRKSDGDVIHVSVVREKIVVKPIPLDKNINIDIEDISTRVHLSKGVSGEIVGNLNIETGVISKKYTPSLDHQIEIVEIDDKHYKISKESKEIIFNIKPGFELKEVEEVGGKFVVLLKSFGFIFKYYIWREGDEDYFELPADSTHPIFEQNFFYFNRDDEKMHLVDIDSKKVYVFDYEYSTQEDLDDARITEASLEIVDGVPRFIKNKNNYNAARGKQYFYYIEHGLKAVDWRYDGASLAIGSLRVSSVDLGGDIHIAIFNNEKIENQVRLNVETPPSGTRYHVKLEEIGGAIVVRLLTLSDKNFVISERPIYVVRREKNKTPDEVVLNEDEQYLLDLLNVSQRPTREQIGEFVKKYEISPDASFEYKKASRFVKGIQDVLKKAAHNLPLAKELFKTLAAQPSGNNSVLVSRAFNLIFPDFEIRQAEKKSSVSNFQKQSSGNLLDSRQQEMGLSGDPRQKGGENICEVRGEIDGFVTNGVFTEYNVDSGIWSVPKKELPLSRPKQGATRETTASEKFYSDRQVLLMPVGAELIASRVKCFDDAGRELSVAPRITTKNGISVIEKPKGATSVSYSFSYPLSSFVPEKSDDESYFKFAQNIMRICEIDREPYAQLPPEFKLFLREIADDAPHIRLQKIQSYVRSITYYDFDFAEIEHLMQGKNITERFVLLRSRMAELRQRNPEMRDALRDKIFACTCADASQIGAALLKASGFVAGRLTGFNIHGGKVNSLSYHVAPFVLWPAEKSGECHIVPIDTTPIGVTEEERVLLEQIGQPGLEELAAKNKSIEKQKQDERLEEFEKISEALAQKNSEEIKKMTNGMIESAVNAMLTVDAKHADAQVIQHVADVLLYSPISLERIDWNSITDKTAVMKFFDEEISRERVRGALHTSETRPGARILESFEMFVKKYQRRYPQAQSEDALDALQQVYDTMKNQFTPIEYRIATVVITYLKAKNVRG